MEDWGWFQRLRYGAVQAVGLGLVAGAVETVGLAASMTLPLGPLDFVLLGALDMTLMGLVGGLLGVATGIVAVGDARPEQTTAPLLSGQLAATAVLLCGLYLWQAAWTLWTREQAAGALAMAAMPLGVGGVVYYNARYWLRRTELGKAPAVGWLPLSAGLAAVVVLGSAALYALRDTGGRYALEGDPNAILITVDRLGRADRLPALERVAEGGIGFADAVSPSTEGGPANASVLTGLHPLRHGLILDGDALDDRYRTLAEALEREGYATGGFVSRDTAGSEAGLDQGFRVFDDDLRAPLPGSMRLNLVWRLGQLLRWVRPGPPAERAPGATVDRFASWYGRHHGVPHFAWIHLVVPTGSQGPELAAVDAAIGRVLDAIEAAGQAERTLVVLAGTHGRPRGRRFLTDAEVAVPLAIRAPGIRVDRPVVEPQVRLLDLAATVMDFTGLDSLGETEGLSLLLYGQGLRRTAMTATLVGRDDRDRPILGMRSGGVKWIRDAEDGDHLYDLAHDPDEARDLAAEQEGAVRQARTAMAPEIVRFRQLVELR